MSEESLKNIKYSTYLSRETLAALKNLAKIKKVSASFVIESALRKLIPAKYYENRK